MRGTTHAIGKVAVQSTSIEHDQTDTKSTTDVGTTSFSTRRRLNSNGTRAHTLTLLVQLRRPNGRTSTRCHLELLRPSSSLRVFALCREPVPHPRPYHSLQSPHSTPTLLGHPLTRLFRRPPSPFPPLPLDILPERPRRRPPRHHLRRLLRADPLDPQHHRPPRRPDGRVRLGPVEGVEGVVGGQVRPRRLGRAEVALEGEVGRAVDQGVG